MKKIITVIAVMLMAMNVSAKSRRLILIDTPERHVERWICTNLRFPEEIPLSEDVEWIEVTGNRKQEIMTDLMYLPKGTKHWTVALWTITETRNATTWYNYYLIEDDDGEPKLIETMKYE